MVTLGNDVTRRVFVVVKQADGNHLAYEEDKDGPGSEIVQVPSAIASTADLAIANLCLGQGREENRI
jgi:hypothetical protein